MSEEWDCPTCGRQVPHAMDYECSTCEMPASHHVPATELCKRIRALQAREASLIVRNKKLEDEVNEQARLLGMSGERECDLRGEMDRERALADRLADSMLSTLSSWMTSPDSEKAAQALVAWKEARGEKCRQSPTTNQ